jgi:hypothetical protein
VEVKSRSHASIAGNRYRLCMATEMPERPVNHSQETWSARAFASSLPPAWLVHTQEADYGIDRRVEIFTDRRATGLEFNVQLKSKRTGSGRSPGVSINRKKLNYWEALASPTLIVTAHEPTNTLWYQWAHLLPFDERPETKSRLVRCVEQLLPETSAALADDVAAFRGARQLASHFPVDVTITGSMFYGQSSSSLRVAVRRLLSSLPSYLTAVHTTSSTPHFYVRIEEEFTVVGLSGSACRRLSWTLGAERDFRELASDIVAALAFEAGRVGANDLYVR